MKIALIGLVGFFALIMITSIVVIATKLNLEKTQITLKEDYDAQQKVLQSAHDNMWKTIQQKYQVADSYKTGFIQSVQAVVDGRKGGYLFKSVSENMPGLSPNVYEDVMATIEGRRDMLKTANDASADIAREYNTFVENPWHGWALTNTTRIDAKIITSSDTNKSYDIGEDNNVILNNNK